MPSKKSLEKNKRIVNEIGELFENNGVYFVDYRGLTVPEIQDLRGRIQALDSNLKILKNRLIIKHFEKENAEYGREVFSGPTAVAYSDEKFVEVAKVLVDFKKEKKKIQIKSGFINKKFVQAEEIIKVSKLPGKDQLMSQFVFSMAYPVKKMGMALSSPLKTMLVLMQNLKDKKAKEENNNG